MDIGNIASALFFGAVSFISPCVLPLLPGYLSLMSGYSVAELQEGGASSTRMLRVTLLFVAGFTVVFVAIGATATSLSGFLTGNQRTIDRIAGSVIILFGVVILALALSNSQKLMFLNRERRFDVSTSRLGDWAPPVMGMAFGFGWTPCIGPTLGAILTVAATQETVGQGMVLLFVFSMGLGIPFIAAGVGIARLYGRIKSLNRHLRTINIASGALMIVFGYLFITGGITEISNFFSELFINLGLDWLAEI